MRIRLIPFVLLCVLAASGVATSHANAADKSATEFIKPVVTMRQFAMLLQPVEITRDQRMILELVFADYLETIESLWQEADEAADAVGRRIVLDAFAGRRLVDVDELRQRRLAVLAVYRDYMDEADVHFEILLSNVRSILTQEVRPFLEQPERQLRRELYLQPVHANRHAYEYAGEGVDVLRMVEDAMREGEELASIDQDLIADALVQYEQRLDAMLTHYGPAIRSVRMNERIARVARDDEALRHAEKQAIELWASLHTLNKEAVAAVAAVIEKEAGADAARRWWMRFDEACFSWLFASTMSDRQYAWIERQSLAPQQREAIEKAYEEYREQRWMMCRAMIDLMIEARRELQRVIHPMMDPSGIDGRTRTIYEMLLRQSGELAGLASAASARLESHLSEHQRTSLRRAVRSRRGR